MSEKSHSKENWEILEVNFKPDMSMHESYGLLEIKINENTYTFEEIPFESDADEIGVEEMMDFLSDELEDEDYASLVEEDFEDIAKECTRDLNSW